MISSAILNLFYLLLVFLLTLLPVGSLPSSVSTSITSVWGFVNAYSYLIAVDTVIQVLVVVLVRSQS